MTLRTSNPQNSELQKLGRLVRNVEIYEQELKRSLEDL